MKWINPFQPSATFHIETSNLFCSSKQMTGFYMKRNTGLTRVKRGSMWHLSIKITSKDYK